MATGDISQQWGTTGTVTHGIASLATSSSKLVGWETNELDISSLGAVTDVVFNVKITTGTSPTTAKSIEVWAIPCLADLTYPGVFDGTSSAETIASAEEKNAVCRYLLASFNTNASSNIAYEATGISLLGTGMISIPKKIVLFVTHDTAVNLNSTAGNHVFGYVPIYENVSS
jgi:hypothetical protein